MAMRPQEKRHPFPLPASIFRIFNLIGVVSVTLINSMNAERSFHEN
jgi:hypothetical protein